MNMSALFTSAQPIKKIRSGFTLMEVMVVIAILGVLATMVMGAYLASQKKGRDVRRKGDLSQLSKALDFYYSDRGRYPASNAGQIVGCGPVAAPIACAWGTQWTSTLADGVTVVTYMVQLPKDPKSSQSYYYDTDASGTLYQLYANLENTEDPELRKVASTIQTYTGTMCATATECTFGFASSNALPSGNGHALH